MLTRWSWALAVAGTLTVLTSSVEAHNILVVVPIPSKSHVILFENLILELANRGHHVTYISAHNLPKPHPNITDITIKTIITGPDGKELNFLEIRQSTAVDNILKLPNIGLDVSTQLLSSEQFQEFLRKKQKFDLLLGEAFLSEGIMSGLSRHFNVPHVGYATFMPSVWINYMVGNEAPSSYIPDPLLGHPYGMSFKQRVENFLIYLLADVSRTYSYLPKQDAIMRKYFGNDHPYVADIVKNTSLLLINDHISTSFPRPLVPNLIGIAGLHIRPPKSLPNDLKEYMDNSKNGVVFFSLGSIVNPNMLSAEKVQVFIDAFGKLKENVIWKFEKNLPNLPKNVKVMKWLPQSDLLAHPNLKLFITHGGLLSTTEAIDRGVPIVGIPIFGDQPMNMRQAVHSGIGVSLHFDEVSVDDLYGAIREVLDNPRYRQAIKQRSARYHDRPVPPMDLAIYWIEYVIRHQGAAHLRSIAQDMKWYEIEQLDVIAFLVLAIVIAYKTALFVLKKVLQAISGKRVSNEKKRN